MTCACGAETTMKDSVCRACRMRRIAGWNRKHIWTPQMDAKLAHAYRAAGGRLDLSRRTTELMRQFRMPRHILQNRAQVLGLRICGMQRWSDAEIELLREYAGTLSIAALGRKLRRTASSVKNKLFMLGIAGEVVEGFSQHELGELFGVHHNKIGGWIGRGWLQLDGERITHESVERFVWDHMDEYRFAACEEWWLKTMLNPSLGVKHAAVSVSREVAA